MSTFGFQIAWTEYQGMMVDYLNYMLAGTPDENTDTKSLLLKHARDPDSAHIFNHASMAHNNHFFFRALAREPVPMPQDLAEPLAEAFSSLETLRIEFQATARAMFGPGFVWLVQHRNAEASSPQFRILTTYLAGSPYAGAHYRQQPIDTNTQSAASLGGLNATDYLRHTRPQNVVGAFGRRGDGTTPGGMDIVPLLCVNTWEHVYLRDWGWRGGIAS